MYMYINIDTKETCYCTVFLLNRIEMFYVREHNEDSSGFFFFIFATLFVLYLMSLFCVFIMLGILETDIHT
jgi:hypothetical protein